MAPQVEQPETGETRSNKKKGLVPILIGLAGAVVLGGGGFFAVYSGLILGTDPKPATQVSAQQHQPLPTYLPIEQLTVSLPTTSGSQHLRLSAEIEVAAGRLPEAEAFRPRFLSVINSYLRAIEPRDLNDPTALIRLRAQILRRLQMIAGEDVIDDFLITEFILS